MDPVNAAYHLNQILALTSMALENVQVPHANETHKRFLCGRGWTVYTDAGEIIKLSDENIMFTDVVGVLSKDVWSDKPYGAKLNKQWQIVFGLDTHLVKEWYSEFSPAYCRYYAPTEFKYPEYVAPIIRNVGIPGVKEHMLMCWINEFKTMDKTKMYGPYPDFTSPMATDLMKFYSDGIRALVTELAHAQRIYIATFGI